MLLSQVSPPMPLATGSPSAAMPATAGSLAASRSPRKRRKRRDHDGAAQDRAAIGVAGGLALATYEGERLLSTKAVVTITSLSRTEINRRVKASQFPKPIPIGPHRIAFRESDIRKFVEATIKGEKIGWTEA